MRKFIQIPDKTIRKHLRLSGGLQDKIIDTQISKGYKTFSDAASHLAALGSAPLVARIEKVESPEALFDVQKSPASEDVEWLENLKDSVTKTTRPVTVPAQTFQHLEAIQKGLGLASFTEAFLYVVEEALKQEKS